MNRDGNWESNPSLKIGQAEVGCAGPESENIADKAETLMKENVEEEEVGYFLVGKPGEKKIFHSKKYIYKTLQP